MRVLMVEADPARASAFEGELAVRCEVRVATSLAEALALLARWRPDLVLADLDLPDSDGLDTYEALADAALDAALIFDANAAPSSLVDDDDRKAAFMPLDEDEGALGRVVERHKIYAAVVAAARRDLKTEIMRAGEEAARRAPDLAMERLMGRLGVEGAEELRLALGVARGFVRLQNRFWSAISSGVATALLLALGAGLIALIKQGADRFN